MGEVVFFLSRSCLILFDTPPHLFHHFPLSIMVVLSTLLFASLASAAPFSLSNGFPNPSASALKQIELQAGGTLPNTALPTSLKADAIESLQVIAVNEIFETAYFSSLLTNVTDGKTGYTDLGGLDKDYVVKSLTAIRAVSCSIPCCHFR